VIFFQECVCDEQGSENKNCSATTSQCTCKEGFSGLSCNECKTGFYGFPNCTFCNCDPLGTEGGMCDATTGQCLCKEVRNNNVEIISWSIVVETGLYRYYEAFLVRSNLSIFVIYSCNFTTSFFPFRFASYAENQLLSEISYHRFECFLRFVQSRNISFRASLETSVIIVTLDTTPILTASRVDAMEQERIPPNATRLLVNANVLPTSPVQFSEFLLSKQLSLGRICDKCAAGFYEYPNCRECSCLIEGAKGQTCDAKGQCYCKDNFDGKSHDFVCNKGCA